MQAKPTIAQQVERYRKFIESTEPVTESIYNGKPMPKFVTFDQSPSDLATSDKSVLSQSRRKR